MRAKSFIYLSVLLILSILLSAGAAFAQAPGRAAPVGPTPGSSKGQTTPGDGELKPAGHGRAASPSRTAAPAVNLGQPGLSFRYSGTIGVTEEPYPSDAQHLNTPGGLFVDSSDNLYVAEEAGYRMLKFNSSGANLLVIGHAGQPWHHDDFLPYPYEVVVRGSDGHIFVMGSPAFKEFDASGNFVQIFPAADPWESGSGNDRLGYTLRGAAFGPGGFLYVSDQDNHRIQLFDVSGVTTTYTATIGTSGVPQSDNSGFNWPSRLAFDSLNRLYVMDSGNYRVQRCTSSAPWTSWTCSAWFGETGVSGDDLNHLGYAHGITIDASDNVFIADSENTRVLKCNTSATCSLFAGVAGVPGSDNAHFDWVSDVAVDSTGKVYVSDINNHRVQKFGSDGAYLATLGVNGVPYVADATRLNRPWGVAAAPDGSLFVTEDSGRRLIKMDASGVQDWTAGQAGVFGSDNQHLGQWWSGPLGVAVNSDGRIFVADTGNNRLQIFNSDGTYNSTFGSYGSGQYQFDSPAGVAFSPVNGDLFVLDHANQRVQVYTSALVYKTSLGVSAETGSDNAHFNWPRGLAVDKDGNLFVADSDNQRVQKCVPSGNLFTCSTFAGQSGVFGDAFDQLHPLAVASDRYGRVYVADEWNNRVQVFDASGAYLTTIGGEWGNYNGQMHNPSGVAVDAQGVVYITDRDNHRVQVFAPGTPGWKQVNINGFGDRYNQYVVSLAEFNSQLYAGTYIPGGPAQIWRLASGGAWSPVTVDGFGDSSNVAIDHMLVFGGKLYASTWNQTESGSNGGQVWRSATGNPGDWQKVVDGGFGDAANSEVFRLAELKGQLYAVTWSSAGAEIWRSSSGDAGSWNPVMQGGFGSASTRAILSLLEYDGYLYAGTYNNSSAEVWRSPSGDSGTWERVGSGGFGDAYNTRITLTPFNGYLYAGTYNYPDSDNPGLELWRCQVCDGSDWDPLAAAKGFGDPENRGASALVVYNDRLFALTVNVPTGLEVWATADGDSWDKQAPSGLGNPNNRGTYFGNSVLVAGGSLYAGTVNSASGGELWRMYSHQVYLPLAHK